MLFRSFTLWLHNAPAGALPFVGLGLPGNEIVCGACTFLDAVSWAFVPQALGTAFWPWAVPNVPAAVGLVVGAQWVLLQAPSSPCNALTGLASTARLHLRVGP